jgi:hypothetical protein
MIASFDAYELAVERGERRRREAAAERLAPTRQRRAETTTTTAHAALDRDYSSASTRCATANAEFAAGTPQ